MDRQRIIGPLRAAWDREIEAAQLYRVLGEQQDDLEAPAYLRSPGRIGGGARPAVLGAYRGAGRRRTARGGRADRRAEAARKDHRNRCDVAPPGSGGGAQYPPSSTAMPRP